jgi:hypothetical protein
MPRPRGDSSTSELVRLAIAGIDAQIQNLMDKRKQLAKLASGAVSVAPEVHANGVNRMAVTRSEVVPAKKKKRFVSAETRKKLKKAAKARWAKVHAERG